MNQPIFNPEDLFPEDSHNIIDNLPDTLKLACQQFQDPTERELFLFSALGVLSGCLPKYIGHYDGKWLSTHLYLYVLAPYGTGKGSMIFAKHLGDAIHRTKRNRSNEALTQYRKEQQQNRKPKKGDSASSASSAMPLPSNEMLFFPADCSKSALIDALNDNNGQGIIFETEGETLTASLKQDYAAYTDILLKAFHHEPVSFMRRQDKEHKEILEPRLAIVLSSTYNNFLSFMKTPENGLVSRFVYYLLPKNKIFRDVFSDEKKEYKVYFEEFGKYIETRYNEQIVREKSLCFQLNQQQQEAFKIHFAKLKDEAEGLEGVVHRLGLICFRIAMILSYFRLSDQHRAEQSPEKITCNRIDFTNALAIIKILHEHAETVHTLLPQNGRGKFPGERDELYKILPEEFTTKEAVILADTIKIGKRTAERFLAKDERLEKSGQGKYKKRK